MVYHLTLLHLLLLDITEIEPYTIVPFVTRLFSFGIMISSVKHLGSTRQYFTPFFFFFLWLDNISS